MNHDKNSWNDYSSEWWVEYLDILPLKCSECKYANEYLLWYWFPHYKPTCSKGYSCYPDKHACKDFEYPTKLWRKDNEE